MIIGTYRDWNIYDTIPKGWEIDGDTHQSPAPNTVFITNGVSPLKGQKRALLKVQSTPMKTIKTIKPKKAAIISNHKKKEISNYKVPARELHLFIREKIKENLLAEIMKDFLVCDLEKWDKKEFLKELKELINSFNFKETKKNNLNN